MMCVFANVETMQTNGTSFAITVAHPITTLASEVVLSAIQSMLHQGFPPHPLLVV